MKTTWLEILALVLFLAVAGEFCSTAQTMITGDVASSDGEPVAGAFVYAYSKAALTGYAISNSEGHFSVKTGNDDVVDSLKFTCMGFRSQTVPLKGKITGLKITMHPQPFSIRESRVTASVVEEKGDTLSFTAAPFSDGTERDLGDLLEKIPGISVTASGGVLYNGQYVNKFYVDGMDLMGAGYGVITNNLSPERIARVEVYKHHQPVKALVGINHTDRSAVNIILKEDARNTWMVTGNAALGASDDLLFDTRAMLTRFSKKSQDLYLLKGNDVGKDITKELEEQRYFGKTGAFLISEDDMDADYRSRLSPVRSSVQLPQEYWFDNVSGVATLNHLRKIDDNRQLRLSLQAASEKYSQVESSSETVSVDGMELLTILSGQESLDRKHFAQGKLSFENNAPSGYLSDELSISGQLRDNSGLFTDGALENTQRFSLPSLKISNDFNSTLRVGDRRAVSLSSNTKFITSDHEADYLTDAFSAHQSYSKKTLSSTNSIAADVSLRHLKVNLSGGLDILYYGIDATLSGMDKLVATPQGSVGVFQLSPGVSAGTEVFIGKTKFRLSMPLSLNYLAGRGMDRHVLFPSLAPSINLQREFSSRWKAVAHASYSHSKSMGESIMPAGVMTSYRTVSESDSLASRQSMSAGGTLDYSDHMAFFYASLSASVSRSMSDRTPSVFYSDLLTISGSTSSKVLSSSCGLNGKLTKYFGLKTFVVELSGAWNTAGQEIYLQSARNTYQTDIFDCALELRSNPVDWFSMEGKTVWSQFVVRGGADSKSSSVDASGRISLKPLKPCMVSIMVDYRYEDVPGMKISNTPLLKTECTWALKKMTLFAECSNLLDCTEYSRRWISAYQTMSTTTRLCGRRMLAGFRLSL